MMKIQKIFLLFAAMMILTAGVLAAPNYTPFTAEEVGRFVYHMPTGLSYTTTAQEGHAEVLVDSGKTNWNNVAASSAMFDAVEFSFDMPKIDGVASCKSGAMYVSPEWYSSLQEGMDDLYANIKNALSGSSGGGWLADVSAETSTIVPSTYDKDKPMVAMMICYDENNQEICVRYATMYITYTDPGAQHIELAGVPKERITALPEGDDVSVSNGAVNYTLKTCPAEQKVKIDVTAPSGAKSYEVKGTLDCAQKMGECNSPVKLEVGNLKEQDYQRRIETFFWYDGGLDASGKPTGNLIGVERLAVNVSIGDPKVFLYYDEQVDVIENTISYTVSRNGGQDTLSGVKMDYADGILTVSPSGGTIQAEEDLTQYGLNVTLTAPSNAQTYRFSSYSEGNVFTTQGKDYLKDGLKNEKLHEVSGGKAALDTLPLFKKTTYSGDAGLTVYYDANATDKANGHVFLIQWYSDENGLNPIGIQGCVVQFETLATTVSNSVMSQVPVEANTPVLAADGAPTGYELRVKSYPQKSEDGTQIHYELSLLNDAGEEVPLDKIGGSAELFIPYPKGVDMENIQATVHHYSVSGEFKEAFGGYGGLELQYVKGGVVIKVQSLSPFVLSWTTISDPTALPRTGDDSQPLAWLILLAAVCTAGALYLARGRKAE